MNEYREPPRAQAAARILDAALEELVARGAASLAMHDVADRAGVSKGLIHYHFHDKNALLAEVAPRLGDRIATRARGALATSATASAIADLERWLVREIELGEWRGLLALAEWPAEGVRRAARTALDDRRQEMHRVLERLLSLLQIRTKMSLGPLTDLAIAVVSGLAAEIGSGRDPSPALDALVMAFYRLGD